MSDLWAFLDNCGWEVLGILIAASLVLDLIAGRVIHEGNPSDEEPMR